MKNGKNPLSGGKISEYFYKKMNAERKKRFENGEYHLPPNDNPIVVDENANLTFIVLGDSQVSNYMFRRQCSFQLGISDISNTHGTLDALVICGDIAENGFKSEYRVTADLINQISGKFKHFIGMPGNHDVRLRPYKISVKRFGAFLKSIKNAYAIQDRFNFSAEINGYKFIVLGTDAATFEGAYISDRQLSWLKNELSAAKKSGKPAFVFNHQTLKHTNGLPNTWLGKGKWRGSVGFQSEKLRKVLSSFSNVFFITGHLHFGVNQYTYEDHGAFKALSVPTVSAGNHGSYNLDAQGYVISVYDDKVVLKGRVFSEGRYVENSIPNFEVTVPLGENNA